MTRCGLTRLTMSRLWGRYPPGGHLLLTVKEAAEELRVSRSAIYQLVAGGQIPSIRIGRSRRIPRAALVAWVGAVHDRD